MALLPPNTPTSTPTPRKAASSGHITAAKGTTLKNVP